MFFLFLHLRFPKTKSPRREAWAFYKLSLHGNPTSLGRCLHPRLRGFASQPFGWFALIMDYISCGLLVKATCMPELWF
jgi:hypothetical protein